MGGAPLFLLELGFVGGIDGSSHSRADGQMLGQLFGLLVRRERRVVLGGLFCHPPPSPPPPPPPLYYVLCISHFLLLHKNVTAVGHRSVWVGWLVNAEGLFWPYRAGFSVEGWGSRGGQA